jgi:hypothetical protein
MKQTPEQDGIIPSPSIQGLETKSQGAFIDYSRNQWEQDAFRTMRILQALFKATWNAETLTLRYYGQVISWVDLLAKFPKTRSGQTIRAFMLSLVQARGVDVDKYSDELPENLKEEDYYPNAFSRLVALNK